MTEIPENTKLRYERKFIAEKINIRNIENIIKMHPAMFSDIHSQRYINNIYLDTPNLQNYYDNVYGKSSRNKYRIRWYGNLFGEIENPILEIKIKTGSLGNKLSFNLPSFKFTKDFNTEILSKILKNAQLPEQILSKTCLLVPTLVNRYSRKYYLDFTRNFRITTDTELTYYKINRGINYFFYNVAETDKIVIELKYNIDNDNKARFITQNIPFRLTKNSKYLSGIEFFYKTGI